MGTTAEENGGVTPGLEALHRLKSTEAPHYLTQSPVLAKAARSASEYLFSSLNPFVPKSPFPRLLTQGFDAEQIWQQIDLQSQPLLSSLARQVKTFEKNPREIEKQFNFDVIEAEKHEEDEEEDVADEEFESESEDDDDEEEEEDEDEDDEEEMGNGNGVEDRFLKIKELEEYLEEDEAREYGLKGKDKRKRGDEDDEEDDDEDDELGVMGLDDNEDDDEDLRYEDFFGRKGASQKKIHKKSGESRDLDMDDSYDGKTAGQKKKSEQHSESDELDDLDMDDEPENHDDDQKTQTLSTHEKEREKLRSEIEKMEKANLEPKTWTMQGEVTAAKRPKNSALEVDLDFEHNVRPAPVITEEVTKSLEDLIQNRVSEGRFDDVQKPPTLPNKAPREKVELDENKSKKGLAEIYEDEFTQKTGLVSKALTLSDEQKKEASMLFKKLCVKLDALSHFHFTPKPVIEEMSIQANVPALAMEEIAPLVVSDAAMLAPEEVFAGKGDIKEETELTKADRKRRRSNKKRKYKAEGLRRMALKTQNGTLTEQRTAPQATES